MGSLVGLLALALTLALSGLGADEGDNAHAQIIEGFGPLSRCAIIAGVARWNAEKASPPPRVLEHAPLYQAGLTFSDSCRGLRVSYLLLLLSGMDQGSEAYARLKAVALCSLDDGAQITAIHDASPMCSG